MSSQLDLQIQCSPNQNPSKLLGGYKPTDSKVDTGKQKAQNTNTTLKQNRPGGLTLSDFKTYYKSYNDQDSVVLVKEQTKGSLEQHGEPRKRPT